MAKQTGTGKIEEFDGQKLSTPISFSYEWDSFASVQEMRDAGAWPNDADILKARNDKAQATAKAGQYQSSTKTLRELKNRTYEKQQELSRQAMLTAGMPAEIADATIRQIPRLQRHVEAQALLDAFIAGESPVVDFKALDANNALA